METGSGDDRVYVGSDAANDDEDPVAANADYNAIPRSTLNQILYGRLTLRGQDGDNDKLFAYDSADTALNVGELSSTEITGLGMPLGIRYYGFEDLELRLSSGNDAFFIASTHEGRTLVNSGA